MASIKSFQKLSLSQVAAQLSIHPFDLIRVLVAKQALPPDFRFSPHDIVTLRSLTGIEIWWTPDTQRPQDDIPERSLLRCLCSQLVARGVIGSNTTRLDNLLRGLDIGEQATLRALIRALMATGLLTSKNTPSGLRVSVVEGREYALTHIAEGGSVPTEAAAVWTRN